MLTENGPHISCRPPPPMISSTRKGELGLEQSMKSAFVSLCFVLSTTTIALGQQANQPHRKAGVEIWVGVGLIAAGLLVVPVTVVSNHNGYDPPVAGAVLVAGGGTLIWMGLRDQRKATQPNTTFGVMFGRKSEIHIRRSW